MTKSATSCKKLHNAKVVRHTRILVIRVETDGKCFTDFSALTPRLLRASLQAFRKFRNSRKLKMETNRTFKLISTILRNLNRWIANSLMIHCFSGSSIVLRQQIAAHIVSASTRAWKIANKIQKKMFHPKKSSRVFIVCQHWVLLLMKRWEEIRAQRRVQL